MKYKTLSSGERKTYSTGMMRDDDQDKVRYDLLIPKDCKHPMLDRWAELLTRGAQKYAPRNHENARTEEELERAIQSLWRHFRAFLRDDRDEDHAAACLFNIELIELIRERLEETCGK
jgi:hypothetical protein